MSRWPFVAWMLGAPVASAAADYLDFLANGSVAKVYSEDVTGPAAIICIVIWFAVGAALYRSPRP